MYYQVENDRGNTKKTPQQLRNSHISVMAPPDSTRLLQNLKKIQHSDTISLIFWNNPPRRCTYVYIQGPPEKNIHGHYLNFFQNI